MPIEESTRALLTVPELRDVYSRLAPLYRIWEKFTESKARSFALELARVSNGERVLEVAVGTGTAFEQLARNNSLGFTAGVDITWAMLKRTVGMFGRPSLRVPNLCQCDARFLPFPEKSFDLVYCAYLLDALSEPDIEQALRELRRVMMPSGRLVLVYLSSGHLWFNLLWGAFYAIMPNLLGGCRPIGLRSMLPQAGFAVQQFRRIAQWGVPSEVILAVRGEQQTGVAG